MALSAAGQSDVETIKSWKLNERHYGGILRPKYLQSSPPGNIVYCSWHPGASVRASY